MIAKTRSPEIAAPRLAPAPPSLRMPSVRGSLYVQSWRPVVASSVNHRHYGALARWLDGLDEAEAPALAVMLRVSEYDASVVAGSRIG